MFFDSKANRNHNKQNGRQQRFSVRIYLSCILSILLNSCSNAPREKTIPHQLPSTDIVKIKGESIFRIYVSKIPATNGSDSLLLLLDRTSAILYKVDTANHIMGVDTLPATVTEGVIAFTYQKGRYYMLYENGLKIFPADNSFTLTPKEYSFNTSDGKAYHSVMAEFNIDSNGSFLIYCIPKLNIGEAIGRKEYFSSHIVHKAIIGAAKVETVPQIGITFPERYKMFYYNDLYPVFCSLSDGIAYTVQYCDSLAIVRGGQKEYFKIPEQFGVTTAPASETCVKSKTESSVYFVTHSANGKLLRYKQKILLFQIIGAEQYTDEKSGMINDLLSLKKRMLIFDMDKKQFEPTAYELPANCNPVKSCVFNGKVYLLSTDDTRKTILVTAFQL